MPAYLVNEARRMDSRYLSLAVAELPEATISATAFCCPTDAPSRAMGRTIALGRLRKRLEKHGWELGAGSLVAVRKYRSAWRGIRAIKKPYSEPQPRWFLRRSHGWWFHLWTPKWHNGRGPYLTVGLGFVAFGRGY